MRPATTDSSAGRSRGADGSSGAIRYGDQVCIASDFADFRGQQLIGDWLSTAKDAEDVWTLEPPAELPPPGPPVTLRAPIHLRHMSGQYVIAADHGRRLWPRLGNGTAVTLKLDGRATTLANRAQVTILSTEPGLGERNTLGAFADSHDCYYWNAGYDAKKQGWIVVKAEDSADRQIHYGEKVHLVNVSYTDQKLAADSRNPGYITTNVNARDWWTIEPQ